MKHEQLVGSLQLTDNLKLKIENHGHGVMVYELVLPDHANMAFVWLKEINSSQTMKIRAWWPSKWVSENSDSEIWTLDRPLDGAMHTSRKEWVSHR